MLAARFLFRPKEAPGIRECLHSGNKPRRMSEHDCRLVNIDCALCFFKRISYNARALIFDVVLAVPLLRGV
jgi:hypothetical protein